tara:strand:- start:1196 stop:1381 length:186 start_codon:yes stop_codon:yes gene_type:complete
MMSFFFFFFFFCFTSFSSFAYFFQSCDDTKIKTRVQQQQQKKENHLVSQKTNKQTNKHQKF